MGWDLTEDSTPELIELPLYLPTLFLSPSRLPEFADALEQVAVKKAKLSKEAFKLEEAMRMKDEKLIEERGINCASLRLEIESLEGKAYERRKELVRRIYVVVSSVKEMRAVKELRCGTGAGASPGMRCFRGKVYVSQNVHEDVIKAMVKEYRNTCGYNRLRI